MECPFCSAEIEDVLKGACNNCWDQQARARERVLDVTFSPDEVLPRTAWTQIICICGFLLLLLVIGLGRGESCFTYRMDDNDLLAIEDGSENEIVYHRENEDRLKVVLMQFELSPSALRDFGMNFSLIYLSPKDYQVYQQDYLNTGRCAARFMNSHAKVVQLIVDNPGLMEELKQTEFKEGTKLQLEGEFLQISEMKRQDTIIPINLTGNFNIFRVESIK